MVALNFTDEPLWMVMQRLQAALDSLPADGCLAFTAANPDLRWDLYDGELFQTATGDGWRYRGMRVWLDVAELLGCRLALPQPLDDTRCRFEIQPLDPSQSWHHTAVADPREKYGCETDYTRIHKGEDPWFLHSVATALAAVDLRDGDRVLELGANRGEGLALLHQLVPQTAFDYLGIDHAVSAIEQARTRYGNDRFRLADLN